MTLRKYLLGILATTILSWASFGLILFLVDPQKASLPLWVSFFGTFSLAALGSYVLLGYCARVILSNNQNIFSSVGPLIRQGTLLALFLDGILILAKLSVLTWWDGLMLLVLLGLVELYFHARNEI